MQCDVRALPRHHRCARLKRDGERDGAGAQPSAGPAPDVHHGRRHRRPPPFVTICALLGVNDFVHGRLTADWGAWWVSQWTGGRSRFCMSADEEGGIFTALQRLAAAGRVDMRRVSVLRVATDFMAAAPGQSEADALAASLDNTFDFVGLENIYRAGSAVVREILGNWTARRDGPPALAE